MAAELPAKIVCAAIECCTCTELNNMALHVHVKDIPGLPEKAVTLSMLDFPFDAMGEIASC